MSRDMPRDPRPGEIWEESWEHGGGHETVIITECNQLQMGVQATLVSEDPETHGDIREYSLEDWHAYMKPSGIDPSIDGLLKILLAEKATQEKA